MKRKKRKTILLTLNIIILSCIIVLTAISLTVVQGDGHSIQGDNPDTDEDLFMQDSDEDSDKDNLQDNGEDGGKDNPQDNGEDANGDTPVQGDTDGAGVPSGADSSSNEDRLTDYGKGLDGLDDEKVGWCFARKKEHEQSGTYEPFDITQYNAYYLNKNVTDEDKVIYLAFDCGYEYGYTPKILDVLKKHNAKGIFFVTESFLATSSDVAARMKEEGHLVGNHTLKHPSLPEKSAETVKDEVIGIEEMFREKTGYELDRYIRPPMGEYSERVLKELQNLGYTTIFWSIAYNDYDVNNQPGKDYVIDHFKDYYHNGAITLTHTVSESNTEALDEVLTFLEEQGFRFGMLDELGQ